MTPTAEQSSGPGPGAFAGPARARDRLDAHERVRTARGGRPCSV
ncbi:hypothetical protein [Streptomyces sp. NPDC002343]